MWQKRIGAKGYVFPGNAGRAFIGREGIEKLYRETLNLAGRMSPHGWRSSLSTLAKDAGWSCDVVELTLDRVHDRLTAISDLKRFSADSATALEASRSRVAY